jgi:hypothetical protein
MEQVVPKDAEVALHTTTESRGVVWLRRLPINHPKMEQVMRKATLGRVPLKAHPILHLSLKHHPAM